MPITHAKVSAIADDPAAVAAGEVVPSDWNADHIGGEPFNGGTITEPLTTSLTGTGSATIAMLVEVDDRHATMLSLQGPQTDLQIDAFGDFTLIGSTDLTVSYQALTQDVNFMLQGVSGTLIFDSDGGVTYAHGGPSLVRARPEGFLLGYTTEPDDGVIANGAFALWLDQTPGATKLMIKAKDSGGTVRSASVNLS